MKVYSCPDEVPYAEPDFSNYDVNRELQRENKHREDLANWLRLSGWNGPDTGKIAAFPVGDGYAQYMLADSGPSSQRQSCLIHLPYGDAWEYRHIEHLPKKAILEEIRRREKLAEIFSKPSED